MFFFRSGLWLLLTCYPFTCFATSCAGGVPANGKQIVEISGVLHREWRWGPPNFGEHPETDSKFSVWIVFTKEPVPVKGGAQMGGKSYASVSEIELSLHPFRASELNALSGKMVLAVGKLWRGTSQGDVTPVVLVPRTVRTTKKAVCRIISGN